MGDRAVRSGSRRLARFELAPPRRFLFPAILLLLSEEPGYGYRLVKELKELRFGRVDRPSVYRALAQLEADGLVVSSPEQARAGNARRVYGVTRDGEEVLRAWMGVINEERACLDRVLGRYQATGTGEAVLAGVEGHWAVLGRAWSPVSSTSPASARARAHDSPVRAVADAKTPSWTGRRFSVMADRSVVLIEARSTVGPISFGVIGLTGWIEAEASDGGIRLSPDTAAHLDISVDGLRSGNSLYDAELLRRIDARRFPTASIDLHDASELGFGNRYRLEGELTFHGATRSLEGTVEASLHPDHRLVVTGEQVVDIRDFGLASPTVLMLRIYPDVRVRLHVEAEPEPAPA
jgi:DNA-binding PadR family transcriptional regulator